MIPEQESSIYSFIHSSNPAHTQLTSRQITSNRYDYPCQCFRFIVGPTLHVIVAVIFIVPICLCMLILILGVVLFGDIVKTA